ncbi:MAG: branched-chain amino acid ABC transporter permease [Ktedonobacterales bacterium]
MLTLASALASGQGQGVILQQIENGITLGAMYALVALGYTLVYGIIELINFAHGDVFMWGTVVCLFLAQGVFKLSGTLTGLTLIGVILMLAVAAALFCGVLNVVIERVAYRPLRRAPRLAPLIAAIGVSFILEKVAELFIGPGDLLFPPIFPTGGINVGTVQILYIDIFIVVLALVLMYGLTRFIQSTKLGRSMRATAQDPEAAALMGVNINRTIMVTFLIGGALAGAAGLFYNLKIHEVQYLAGFQLGLIAFTAAVLGGIGNIYGAVLGGFLIGLIEALATQLIPSNGFAYQDVVVFAILVLILVLRPSGLLGQQVPDKV